MAEGRKTVAVVRADVSGSTELSERLDREALRGVMERCVEILESGRLAFLPVRHVIVGEGGPAAACYVTLERRRRGDSAGRERLSDRPRRSRPRLRLRGADRRRAPVTAATRERTLLLADSRTRFDALLYGSTIGSYAFFEAVKRDLMTALRQADRPQARRASAAL